MNKPTIGFIGLGLMGSNIAECLQNNGFDLVVLGRNKVRVVTAAGGGAVGVSTTQGLAGARAIVMLCVTWCEAIESCVFDDVGTLSGTKEGATLIDVGTSMAAATRKIGAAWADKGVGMLDAPLGRTPAHAKDGLLNIMAAGDLDTYEKIKPVLDVLGENVFHLGALGAGHVAKLVNNFMGMTTVVAMSQAFAIADRAGVDRQQLFDIMSSGPSNSPFMHFAKKYAVDGVSDLGFSIANASKDVGYFLAMVEEMGVRVEIAEGTSANLQGALDAGIGDGNVPEIFDFFMT